MAIKGAKTIAEYAIRKWLQNEGFVIEHFDFTMDGNEAELKDTCGNAIRCYYDPVLKEVIRM